MDELNRYHQSTDGGYRKCRCGCGAAVSPEYWREEINVDRCCPRCFVDISVHGRHDLIGCLNSVPPEIALLRLLTLDVDQCLAAVRRLRESVCCYIGDTCDCKYGYGTGKSGEEVTGCPELRDVEKIILAFKGESR